MLTGKVHFGSALECPTEIRFGFPQRQLPIQFKGKRHAELD